MISGCLQALLHARFERALKEGELPQDTDTDALTAAMAILDAPPRR